MVVLVFSVGYLTKEDKEVPTFALTTADVKVAGTGEKEQLKNISAVSEENRLASAGSTPFRIPAKMQSAEAITIVQTSTETMADTLSAAEQSLTATKKTHIR